MEKSRLGVVEYVPFDRSDFLKIVSFIGEKLTLKSGKRVRLESVDVLGWPSPIRIQVAEESFGKARLLGNACYEFTMLEAFKEFTIDGHPFGKEKKNGN